MRERIDLLRVFDYALSNGEIELVLEHDKSGHKNDSHPNCPVCQNDIVNVT